MSFRTMNQKERRIYLIEQLLQENPALVNRQIPESADEQKMLLKSMRQTEE